MIPADPSSRSYAAEVARLLWPAPWEEPQLTRDRADATPTCREAYVFPSRRRPRLLVPADLPASATMLRRLGAGRSQLAAPARMLLERSVRSRAFPMTRWPVVRTSASDPAADSIERHLSECLHTSVRVGVLLGTRRANQKPVLQIFRADGTVLGYAKIGHNDLTATLVRREAAALASVTALLPQSFRAPRVRHHATWAGLEVLVVSPLPTTDRRVPPATRLAASRELAELAGTSRSTLSASRYWSGRRSSAAALSHTSHGDRLRRVVEAVERRHGAAELTFGGWHGDWGNWNMGMADGLLQVWDWERYDDEVPIGFDTIHFAAQLVRPEERNRGRQEAAFLDAVPDLLAAHGVRPRQQGLTLNLYLLEMGLRYVEALQYGTTPTLRRRTDWVLSLAEHRLKPTGTRESEGTP